MDRGGSPNEWSPRGPQIPGDSAPHWITAVRARPHDSVIECNRELVLKSHRVGACEGDLDVGHSAYAKYDS